MLDGRLSLSDLRQHAASCTRRPIVREGYRRAAVLILLQQDDDAWRVLLTKRQDDLPEHGGQIAFPGGAVDEGETPEETALREADEEIGLSSEQVEVLGMHNDIVTPSGFIITPVIGHLRCSENLRANPAEVSRIFTVPLDLFLDENQCEIRRYDVLGEMRDVYFYRYDGETIWGATALMLRQFLSCIGL